MGGGRTISSSLGVPELLARIRTTLRRADRLKESQLPEGRLPHQGPDGGRSRISLGGGGGGIYVGILTAFFNVPPAIAAATSLATIIPTTTIGTISHWKAGNVNRTLGLIMISGAGVGAIVGSLCSDFLPQAFTIRLPAYYS